ncbi:MAG: hypothetical protein WBF17_04590 [Phycisphaerae bacterium]
MPRKRKSLNEDVFVEDCASGMYTHQQLADKHGISLSLAKQIASGQRRPELQERIAAARKAACRRTEDRLIGLLGSAVEVLVRAMEGPTGAPALSAARAVFDRVLGRCKPQGAAQLEGDCEPLEDVWRMPTDEMLYRLSPETKLQMLKELGGPLPGDDPEFWRDKDDPADDDPEAG